jgi:hypothetical protein
MYINKSFSSGSQKIWIQVENWKNKGRACKISFYHFDSMIEKRETFYLTLNEIKTLTDVINSNCITSMYDVGSWQNQLLNVVVPGVLCSCSFNRNLSTTFRFAVENNTKLKLTFFEKNNFIWFLKSLKKISEARYHFLLCAEIKRRNFGRRIRKTRKTRQDELLIL